MIDQAGKVATNLIDYSPLIGAIIAGFFAVFGIIVANWLNSRSQKAMHDLVIEKEKRTTRLQKAEDLYICLNKWKNNLDSVYILHLRYIVGKIAYKDLCKILEENRGVKDERVGDTIPMLIRIYFPDFLDSYNDILEKRDVMSKYVSENVPKNYNYDTFNKEMSDLDSSFKSFFDKISEFVREM